MVSPGSEESWGSSWPPCLSGSLGGFGTVVAATACAQGPFSAGSEDRPYDSSPQLQSFYYLALIQYMHSGQ